jgi:uridine phosphorylase
VSAGVTGTIHLHPTAPPAERVLLPGDPGRALLLAQSLLRDPVMFNHHRGLWGYTGTAPDELEMTIQSTGMGGPSAAIVVAELAQLGARRLVRVGTCGSLDARFGLGELLVADPAISDDGASQALGGGRRQTPSPPLREALLAAAGGDARAAPVVSSDLFYHRPDDERRWIAEGAVAVDMETATLLALAALHQLEAASLLLVTDVLDGGRARIEPDALRAGELRLGEVALTALAPLTG